LTYGTHGPQKKTAPENEAQPRAPRFPVRWRPNRSMPLLNRPFNISAACPIVENPIAQRRRHFDAHRPARRPLPL